MKTIT